jgi:cysteine desulfurase
VTLFLDANAHLPLHYKALEAYAKFNGSVAGHGHPMATNVPGRAASSALEEARGKIAQAIGATSKQVFFTSTCTQACEWGLEILKAQNFDRVFTSTIEHKSVAAKAHTLFGNNDLFVNKHGVVSCAFDPGDNSAFICLHVQNEIGTVQPIQDIKVPFFCDMSQSLGKIPVDVSKYDKLKIATFGAHKFGGPVGVGILYLQDPKWWQAFGTGSRYHQDRPGTPDAGMIVATSVALEEAIKTLPKRYERAVRFRSIIEDAIKDMGLDIIGGMTTRVPHTTFFNVGHGMAPYIMTQLEAEGMHVGLGSACGAIVNATNPVMTAMGYPGKAADYLRVSQWGEYGIAEAPKVARALRKYCPKVQAMS